jgi:hypothetical protein
MNIDSQDEIKSSEVKTTSTPRPDRSIWPVFFLVLLLTAILVATAIYQSADKFL